MSCLARQAKELVAEVEENYLYDKANERWGRWHKCSLCEQNYHGVVRCALGWACWKTYLGRPETDQFHGVAMGVLANGLCDAKHHEAAMSVREARLSLARRLGDSEFNILVAKGNLANSYQKLGRHEEALSMRQEVYSGHLKLNGREHPDTLREAENYTLSLFELERFEEARSLLRRIIRVARRVLGASHDTTIRMSRSYAKALAKDPGATLDDLREAVTMLEDTERTARRVLGSAHPITTGIEHDLRVMRDAVEIAVGARETPS